MKWGAVESEGAYRGNDREGDRVEASHRENVGGTGLYRWEEEDLLQRVISTKEGKSDILGASDEGEMKWREGREGRIS